MITFIYALVFVALVIASITDIQTREVPDILSYGLLVAGFFLNIILSIVRDNINYVVESVAGFLFCFVFSLILFYTGQWGGGDAKLIWGIGASIGLPISLEVMPFLILFLVNSFFVGAIFGVFWMLTLAIRHYRDVSVEVRKNFGNHKIKVYTYVAVLIILTVLPIIAYPQILEAYHIYLLFVLALLALPPLLYLVRLVEAKFMYKKLNLEKLVPGDWVIESKETIKIGFKIPKTGVSEQDIMDLKNSDIEEVMVKEGIPFVPSFLIAFIITELFGNWFLDLILIF